MLMIKRLRLQRYKGFSDYSVSFTAGMNVLVGPNNAGKTTIINAMRLAGALLGIAQKRAPNSAFTDGERTVWGHPLSPSLLNSAGFVTENVRHEFRSEESRLALEFTQGGTLHIVWPEEGSPFFYIDRLPGLLARTGEAVRGATGAIGVIPTLTPLENRESLLSEKYVRENLSSRLASRHFRNQLHLARSASSGVYEEFQEFCLEHTPEIAALSLILSGGELDLYITEATTKSEKELFWAGDGLQVWVQEMYHILRLSSVKTLVLDEPDVFLHPDLQRRLISLLETREQQVVVATHAPEMLTEAPREAIIWVDRTRRSATRARSDATLSALNLRLGSGFNLGMAKALRSRLALFVEGDDMKILRNLAGRVGAERVRRERGLAVISLGGFSNWHQVEPFGHLTRGLLGDAVKIHVILDRDYRSDALIFDLEERLRNAGVDAHVWRKKELESYLLVPSAIARSTGVEQSQIEQMLDESAQGQKYHTQANYLLQRQKEEVDATHHAVSVNEAALPEFEALWAIPARRLELAPAKELLSGINGRLQAAGKRTVSARSISALIRREEVDSEMTDLLLSLDEGLA